jgi:hypothetical protein
MLRRQLGRYCVAMLAVTAWLPVSGLAQEDTWSGGMIYPQSMWSETYRAPYTSDAEIRDRVSSPSEPRRYSPAISIPAKTFNEYYEFLKRNKGNVFFLRILGATNDDIERLSNLDSLICLALPVCKADNFRPLTELKNLQELRVANPNLEQFKKERLLGQMESLSDLTLYNVADLRAALDLPGLEPCLSPEDPQAKGIFTLRVYAPSWNPRHRIQWPEKAKKLPNLCLLTDRIWFAYLQGQRAEIIMSRSAQDDPALASRLLKDLIEKSGFYDGRQVDEVDLTSQFKRWGKPFHQPIVTHDKTDLSPLRAFSELKYLNLEGDFYGFENLRNAPLQRVYYNMYSPTPSAQAVEVLSKHPTLLKVEKNIESATYEVMWEREQLEEPLKGEQGDDGLIPR